MDCPTIPPFASILLFLLSVAIYNTTTQCTIMRLGIRITPAGAVGMKGGTSAHPKNIRL
jgi:hypothetical protein